MNENEKSKQVGSCIGRNGYFYVYDFNMSLDSRVIDGKWTDAVDINFTGVSGQQLNAGGSIEIERFIKEVGKLWSRMDVKHQQMLYDELERHSGLANEDLMAMLTDHGEDDDDNDPRSWSDQFEEHRK